MKIRLQNIPINPESNTSILQPQKQLQLNTVEDSSFVAIVDLNTENFGPDGGFFVVCIDVAVDL